jgi:hypothetical protein
MSTPNKNSEFAPPGGANQVKNFADFNYFMKKILDECEVAYYQNL